MVVWITELLENKMIVETNFELKECPFCGGNARLSKTKDEQGELFNVFCVVCFAKSSQTYAEADTVKRWNTRPNK